MKTKLPIRQTTLLDNGKVEIKESEIEVDIDTSLMSQIRYESKFPELAKHEDIYQYSQRIFDIKEQSATVLIGKLKAFYCWIDTDISFTEFVKMFTGSAGKDYQYKLYKKIEAVVKAISESSSEKN